MLPAEVILLGSIAFILYTYAGYPLLLWVLSRFRRRGVRKETISPSVSLIIAVHNEEARIREKLENTLSLIYPKYSLQLIVASDCSTDRTDDIAREYRDRGVQLARLPERGGKEAAQKLALESATGEIVAFSDAAVILPPDAIQRIVMGFADPSVGCVSSVDRLLTDVGVPGGEGAYVRYEMLLRELETNVGSLVGLSGSFFAARRDVCSPWRTDLQSDFTTLFNTVRRKMRGISDSESVAYYRAIVDPRREYDRKVRTVLRGITVLADHVAVLNPLRYGLFSWQLLSHKLFRWLVPYALIAALVTNVLLATASPGYRALLVLQGAFYLFAVAGITHRPPFLSAPFRLPAFTVQVNGSILHAWFHFLRGRRVVGWSPSSRASTAVSPLLPGRRDESSR